MTSDTVDTAERDQEWVHFGVRVLALIVTVCSALLYMECWSGVKRPHLFSNGAGPTTALGAGAIGRHGALNAAEVRPLLADNPRYDRAVDKLTTTTTASDGGLTAVGN